jgi:amino acid adenylation domain-containing protein
MGLGPQALVGVCVARSPSLIVALLAILKAGAAYVPVAPTTPAPRVAELFSGVAVIITDRSSETLVAAVDAPKIPVDDPRLVNLPTGNLTAACPDDHLAYVMFTSGSTGAPRGVCVPHRAVVRLVRATDYARLAPDEVFLQLAPVDFDASTFEIWGALLNGAALVLAPARRLSVAEIGALIVRYRVTTLWLTSGLFELFIEVGLDQLRSVRQLLTGGDIMSVPHAERFLRHSPGCRLINCYGPTENTTFTATHVVDKIEAGCAIPIGRPIAHGQVYVLDGRLQPVPIGVVGEGYVSGRGLARGYLNDEQATHDRFIGSPFAEGSVLYKTGDRLRRRADGMLEFIGRTDDQVKIRGFRVEPGEVERLLQECPGVNRAAVRPEKRSAGDPYLVAYIVPQKPDPDLLVKLRSLLRARVPAYMVPAEFQCVEELPLTANGKLDRGALSPATRNAVSASVQPRDPLEQSLATLFADSLGVSVGIHDDFFDAGGDSLSAMALGARIERTTGRGFPLATLFDKPTVAELAEDLRERSAAPPSFDPLVVPIKEGQTARPLFLVAGGHGGKAELMICARLVSRLQSDSAVFGLLAPATAVTVEAIAAAHVDSIRRVQPRGPYRIGGECVGGVVAYEIAQQLHTAGETIALLLLLDTWRPTTAGVVHHWLVGQPLARLKGGLSFLAGLRRRESRSESWWREFRRRSLAPAQARHYMRACMRYRPVAFGGRVTILASEDNLQRGLSHGWTTLAADGVAIHRAPGDHQSYSRAHARESAELLRICLEEHVEGRSEREHTGRS